MNPHWCKYFFVRRETLGKKGKDDRSHMNRRYNKKNNMWSTKENNMFVCTFISLLFLLLAFYLNVLTESHPLTPSPPMKSHFWGFKKKPSFSLAFFFCPARMCLHLFIYVETQTENVKMHLWTMCCLYRYTPTHQVRFKSVQPWEEPRLHLFTIRLTFCTSKNLDIFMDYEQKRARTNRSCVCGLDPNSCQNK